MTEPNYSIPGIKLLLINIVTDAGGNGINIDRYRDWWACDLWSVVRRVSHAGFLSHTAGMVWPVGALGGAAPTGRPLDAGGRGNNIERSLG